VECFDQWAPAVASETVVILQFYAISFSYIPQVDAPDHERVLASRDQGGPVIREFINKFRPPLVSREFSAGLRIFPCAAPRDLCRDSGYQAARTLVTSSRGCPCRCRRRTDICRRERRQPRPHRRGRGDVDGTRANVRLLEHDGSAAMRKRKRPACTRVGKWGRHRRVVACRWAVPSEYCPSCLRRSKTMRPTWCKGRAMLNGGRLLEECHLQVHRQQGGSRDRELCPLGFSMGEVPQRLMLYARKTLESHSV